MACDSAAKQSSHATLSTPLTRNRRMAILTEISWDDMFDGRPLPENPVRKAFREAVDAVAERARTAVPELNGRVERAVQIILNGDLSIAPDGQGKIASQSNGHIEYLVGKGDTCSCKDH